MDILAFGDRVRGERRGRKGVINEQGDKFGQGGVGVLGDLFSRLVLLFCCMASVCDSS